MCDTLWGRALLRFLQGDASGAREALAAAVAGNRHVADFLLHRQTMPRRDDGHVAAGGPDEAAEHVRLFGKAWRKHPAALAWLRESLKGQAPRARAWEETEGLLQGLLDRLDEACLPLVAARARELMPACPWPTEGLHPEHLAKQLVTWYALDRLDADTGKTPLRTFAEREVRDMVLRDELLRAEHPLLGEHIVVGEQDGHLLLEEVGTREVRRVKVSEATLRQAHEGAHITGVLHPWGDHWRTNGIIQIRESEERAAQRLGLVTPRMVDAIMHRYEQGEAAKAEGIVLRETSTLESVLNKYPSQWVDGIAVALGLERRGRKGEKAAAIAARLRAGAVVDVVRALPEPSRAALRFLVERGGAARMGEVEKRFSTGVGLFWVERPPASDVGLLRLKGLVVVGKMGGPGGRKYRVAAVPRELRPAVAEALGGVLPG